MTFGSLFSGCGGIDLGLERAGMTCKWQVEIDEFCRKVLAERFTGVTTFADIKAVRRGQLEYVDLIAGGYPCQPFSVAGKRGGEDDPRHLWPHFRRIICDVRPRYALLENVPGHLSLGFGKVLSDLARLGYDAEWLCLRASDFGASHLRKRVFIVAHADGGQREQRGRAVAGEGWGISGLDGGGGAMGDPAGARFGHGQPGASGEVWNGARGEEFDGRRDALADPRNRQLPQPGRGPEGRDGARSAGAVFPDAGEPRLSDAERETVQREGRRYEGRATSELCGPFAPGPNDPRWPAILAECPWLAPSAQSPIRGVVDGIPDWLDRAMSNRTKRLGRLGNAVVPQVAEWIGERILEAEHTR